jgi:cytidine deaminase
MAEVIDAEDAKLITLARAARARTGAVQGAAVRDLDGRTYAAATVELPSLRLTALQVAVAMALSAGAACLEAAVVLAGEQDPAGARAVAELSPSAPVYRVAADGTPIS